MVNCYWKGLIAKVGPAMKMIGLGQNCTATDVGQASWAKCGAAALSVMEPMAEQFGAGHRLRGISQIARTGFDTSVAGDGYAKFADKEVFGSMAQPSLLTHRHLQSFAPIHLWRPHWRSSQTNLSRSSPFRQKIPIHFAHSRRSPNTFGWRLVTVTSSL